MQHRLEQSLTIELCGKRWKIAVDLENHINVKNKKSILSHLSPLQVTKAGPIKAVAALIKAKPIQIETEQGNLINKKINFKAGETTCQINIATI